MHEKTTYKCNKLSRWPHSQCTGWHMWINLAGRGKGYKKFGSFDIADIAFNMSIARCDQLEEKDTDRNKKYKIQWKNMWHRYYHFWGLFEQSGGCSWYSSSLDTKGIINQMLSLSKNCIPMCKRRGDEFFLFGIVILFGVSQFTRPIHNRSFLLDECGIHWVAGSISMYMGIYAVVGRYHWKSAASTVFIMMKVLYFSAVQLKVFCQICQRDFSNYACLSHMSK